MVIVFLIEHVKNRNYKILPYYEERSSHNRVQNQAVLHINDFLCTRNIAFFSITFSIFGS
jgi:hypothetical protein